MNPIANASLEDRLQQNLQAQLDCTRQLAELLSQERGALVGSDVERLEQLTQAKAEAAGQLQNLHRGLLQLRGNSRQALDLWLGGLRAALLAQWRQLIELAEQCRRANDDNAQLLASREAQLRNTLRVLRPAGSAEVYGRRGSFDLGLPGRSFGSA
ncbi:Flagellar biosynthesis/type III secretory pathway chaperone [Solimonas aquatica]|uniref:Flagellar biosynthesis/type III secretory pathway chaperone n=1 Tax=Solimonas aquatica TaxID=489703 RepID=A0A1H9E2X9_9GAMM|nr:flagellar protein FlgN [Solimonas aquatica]SEQ19308.1 Flagellar biosynthesis/type III secretory pathway chaperone [Solimonas aquatica]